jgi:hypothetical protein
MLRRSWTLAVLTTSAGWFAWYDGAGLGGDARARDDVGLPAAAHVEPWRGRRLHVDRRRVDEHVRVRRRFVEDRVRRIDLGHLRAGARARAPRAPRRRQRRRSAAAFLPQLHPHPPPGNARSAHRALRGCRWRGGARPRAWPRSRTASSDRPGSRAAAAPRSRSPVDARTATNEPSECRGVIESLSRSRRRGRRRTSAHSCTSLGGEDGEIRHLDAHEDAISQREQDAAPGARDVEVLRLHERTVRFG